MILKNAKRIILLVVSIHFILNAQVITGSKLIKDTRTGESTIVKKKTTIKDKEIITTFTVDVDAANKYYLSAFVMGKKNKQKFNKLNVFVNDEKISSGQLKLIKTSWHMAQLNDAKGELSRLSLKAGENKISFKCKVPFTPNIEFLRLTTDENSLEISATNFNEYLDKILVLS